VAEVLCVPRDDFSPALCRVLFGDGSRPLLFAYSERPAFCLSLTGRSERLWLSPLGEGNTLEVPHDAM
jgi:hypothetical protein